MHVTLPIPYMCYDEFVLGSFHLGDLVTGMKYAFLCFPLFLIEEEKANRVAVLYRQKGEENVLLLTLADGV